MLLSEAPWTQPLVEIGTLTSEKPFDIGTNNI